ncbi:hypothetical protein HRI_001404400 [Hibiscus trionum]|uniref:DUF7769 domain-containing protein n=1 Tax=Hibiscus trionum TaxID=183268 RepID=A0A9W7HHL2_HIBTR|nr:hypothetical protein HRI_001404400 [Hibiscus trionum]
MESFLITTNTLSRQLNKQLSKEQRQALFETLLKLNNNGKLPKGSIHQIAAMFLVSTKTVSRLWNKVKRSVEQGIVVDVGSLYHRRTFTKRMVSLNMDRILEIPLRRRTNIRSMAKALDMSKSTLHRRIREGLIKPHTNAIKPYLTDANKRVRLQFCLSMLQPGTLTTSPLFIDMFNIVHIDEKWFYLSKTSERYYLHPHEVEPFRSCKSKRFITKVMFLAAVARPCFDEFSNCMFSGKIGIFPFVFKEPARRNNKNRQAGTLETKPILSVTKDVTRSCLINKVLPVIRAKWPSFRDKNIFIQQDNAKPHIDIDDEQFLQAASLGDFNFQLFFQLSNSPDLNVLDLGYFRAIQSLQHQESPSTIDELVMAVEKSFDELPVESLNNVFLTLQSCMIEIMKVKGGNNYKLPHIGKKRLERNGEFPIQLHCDQDVVQEALMQIQLQHQI